MRVALKSFAAVAAFLMSTQAAAEGWAILAPQDDQNLTLQYSSDGPVSYLFECRSEDIAVTQTGVTDLMDFATGEKVADDAQDLPATAAMMALYAGKGQPDLEPAKSRKNPAGGWDLTLTFKKKDRRLKALAKSEMMSLFTSGFTMAVMMDDDSRSAVSDFLTQCQAG